MPRLNVIILDKPGAIEFPDVYHYVMWADVPSARQVFYKKDATFKSAWKDALPADNTALQNGVMDERAGTIQAPKGSGMAPIQAELQTRWTAYQAEINATGASNPWQRYGSTWDGTTWTLAGVA